MSDKDNGKRIHVGTYEEIIKAGTKVVSGQRNPVAVFLHQGELFAVDNRCPHLGFPLHRGTLRDGILTCHWHHARFDLRSGCTFDLFADDVPAYDVIRENGDVFISAEPRERATRELFYQRLRRGLEQNIGLVQAKGIVGLLDSGEGFESIVRYIAEFGCANNDDWMDGMTTLAVVSNLWPHLSEETRRYALVHASRRVASNCAGKAARRRRFALDGEHNDSDLLKRWFRRWVLVRHRDGAERTLITAAERYAESSEFNELLFSGISDRIYQNTGHTFDFGNKSVELLGLLGWSHAEPFFATLTPGIASGRGEEERSAWRNPTDLVPLIREAEKRLEENLGDVTGNHREAPANLRDTLLGEDPHSILETLVDSLLGGMDPLALVREIGYCGAIRLARFPESNEVGDWFNPVHTFIYINAVYQTLARSSSAATLRSILHAAMSVYIDRFLNIPAARLPGEKAGFAELSEDADALLQDIMARLDERVGLDIVPALAARYVRSGHDRNRLIDTLAMATLREDLDFHKIQVLEAGVRQAALWPQGSRAVEHIFVGVARHLTAHCPTRRAESHITRIAMRLHRGEAIYEEEDDE